MRAQQDKLSEDFSSKQKNAKIIVINEYSTNGRIKFPLNIRPSLLQKFRETTIGPLHIAIEHAMNEFLEKIQTQEDGTILVLNTEDFKPNPEDIDAAEKLTRKRSKVSALGKNEQENADEKSAD